MRMLGVSPRPLISAVFRHRRSKRMPTCNVSATMRFADMLQENPLLAM